MFFMFPIQCWMHIFNEYKYTNSLSPSLLSSIHPSLHPSLSLSLNHLLKLWVDHEKPSYHSPANTLFQSPHCSEKKSTGSMENWYVILQHFPSFNNIVNNTEQYMHFNIMEWGREWSVHGSTRLVQWQW